MTKTKFVTYLSLCLALLTITSCSKKTKTTEEETTTTYEQTTTTENTTIDIPTIADLQDDPLTRGIYHDIPNQNRVPLDSEWAKVLERKTPLEVGETYTETFDNGYFDTRFFPSAIDESVDIEITDDIQYSIDEKSLVMISPGNYDGIMLSGMKFITGGTYTVSFDYKIVQASNDFFLQFRSFTGGESSDKFTVISGPDGKTGTINKTFNLDNYPDYQLMIFPRNNPGTLVIDNLTVTRLNTRPMVLGGEIQGDLEVGSTLQYDYTYFDIDKDEESTSDVRWFTALNKQGLNKTILSNADHSLVVTNDLNGKYVGVEIIPKSVGDDEQSVGNVFYIYSKTPIGGISNSITDTINLTVNESFLEDFEQDTNVSHNIFFTPNSGVKAYITDNQSYVIDGDKSLYIDSPGQYFGVDFSGIKFVENATYNISFDYRFIEKPDNLYIQLRTPVGWTPHDKFTQIDMSGVTVSEDYTFNYKFSLDDFNDYFFMMFTSSKGGKFIIDNLKITRLDETSIPIIDRELNVGESIYETFDDVSNTYLGIDNSQTPNSRITNEEGYVIDGRSLYIESEGDYKCLFIHRGLIYSPNATYKVSFDYKILSFVDTIYFQFNNGQTVFHQFGTAQEIGQVHQFEETFILGSNINYVIQIFPGASLGDTKLIIDNIRIERVS